MTQYTNIHLNLWRHNVTGKYYRLFAFGVTPNNCWLYGAKMVELIDIDVKTGKDVFGAVEDAEKFGGGIVPASYQYIRVK